MQIVLYPILIHVKATFSEQSKQSIFMEMADFFGSKSTFCFSDVEGC